MLYIFIRQIVVSIKAERILFLYNNVQKNIISLYLKAEKAVLWVEAILTMQEGILCERLNNLEAKCSNQCLFVEHRGFNRVSLPLPLGNVIEKIFQQNGLTGDKHSQHYAALNRGRRGRCSNDFVSLVVAVLKLVGDRNYGGKVVNKPSVKRFPLSLGWYCYSCIHEIYLQFDFKLILSCFSGQNS